MKNKIIILLSVLLLVVPLLSISASAHSGRTDANGGHYDRSTGEYHYHNGGHSSNSYNNSYQDYNYNSTPVKTYATEVKINNMPENITIGESVQLESSVYPSDAVDNEISWESSNTDVATVDSKGKLKAVGVGKSTITAKTSKGTKSSVTVTVNELEAKSIKIGDKPKELTIDETKNLYVDFTPNNTTNKDITWKSENPDIVKIDKDGKITAVSVGTTTISASHKKLKDSFKVKVNPIEAKSITIGDKPKELRLDETKYLYVDFTPVNTTNKDISWKSENPDIAKVDKNGKITAVSVGTTTISAIHKKLSDSFKVEVKPIEAEKVEIKCYDEDDIAVEEYSKLSVNNKLQFKATISPDNTTDKSIKWSVDNTEIATIDENGILTGLSDGIVKITAKTSNDKVSSFEIECYTPVNILFVILCIIIFIGLVVVGIVIWCIWRKKKTSVK